MRRTLLVCAVAAGLACSIARSAPAAPPAEDPLAAARKAVVGRLETLATWCDGSRLPGERDRVFRRILVFEPDHARARAGLKFKRADKKSPWVQAADYREPADWNKGLLPEAAKRRAEAAHAWNEAGTLAVEKAEGKKAVALRELVTETAIDLAPDVGDFRRARGDVERDGKWFLAETVDGERRRGEIAASVRKAREAAPAALLDVDAVVKKWKSGATNGTFSVYGRVSQQETEAAAEAMGVSRVFVGGILGEGGAKPSPTQAILFRGREDARAWIESRREHQEHGSKIDKVSAFYLNSGIYVAYWSDAEERLAGAVKTVALSEVVNRWQGRSRGWLYEGLGQRLCWYMLGRHGAGTVDISGTEQLDADDETTETPLSKDADRIGPAAGVLQRDPGRRIRALLTMSINAVRTPDSFAAYALASYLLEARPESLRSFLDASMKLDDADAICQQALGVDAETLAWRIRRWAMESAPR